MSLDEVKARIEECNDDIEDINKKLGGLKDSIYSNVTNFTKLNTIKHNKKIASK